MAGGNLSPRQKMINMMYLVLTALLALNVSAEILEAFSSLRASLASSAESFVEKNDDTRAAIQAKVAEEMGQGNSKNKYVLELNDQVKAKSDEMHKYFKGVIAKLEEIAGKDEATGELTFIKETEANFQYWLGNEAANNGRGSGEALTLRKKLNDYTVWANDFIKANDSAGMTDIKFPPIAIDPAEDKRVPESSESKNLTWEVFTFHGKPVIADLAMMEKFKLDVEEVTSNLLNFLKAKLGAVTFKIDSLIAVDAPVSRVVAAGMKFETKLFVAMSSKDVKPEFFGSGISVDPGGNSATMTFTAPGGFAKGQTEREASYQATIKVPKADGSVAELPVRGTYTIRKPEVVITSASVQNLYYKCGNIINVDVPALGDLYNPKFTASSAEVLTSKSDKRKITIVPGGKTCVLGVSSLTNGQNIKIDDIKYKVIKPPRPSISLVVSGKEYNGARPINKKSQCVVKLRPDSDFASSLPRDARYQISKISLLSARSLGAPVTVGSYNGSGKDATKGIPIALGNKLKQDPPGTKIYFKIDKIYRVNFKGAKIPEKFGDRELYIGAVIK